MAQQQEIVSRRNSTARQTACPVTRHLIKQITLTAGENVIGERGVCGLPGAQNGICLLAAAGKAVI
jgi:hypothetical protein